MYSLCADKKYDANCDMNSIDVDCLKTFVSYHFCANE